MDIYTLRAQLYLERMLGWGETAARGLNRACSFVDGQAALERVWGVLIQPTLFRVIEHIH